MLWTMLEMPVPTGRVHELHGEGEEPVDYSYLQFGR